MENKISDVQNTFNGDKIVIKRKEKQNWSMKEIENMVIKKHETTIMLKYILRGMTIGFFIAGIIVLLSDCNCK